LKISDPQKSKIYLLLIAGALGHILQASQKLKIGPK
jgi:hypothetical protein